MNPTVTGANGMVVVTQILPSTGQHAVQMGPNALQNTPCQFPEALQKFFKGEPKALGVVQILIGIIQIFFGILLAANAPYLFVVSAVPFWGGLIFIISGSLSVAAQNHANICLVKGSLGMNIVSSLAAFVGIIIICIDLGFVIYINIPCQRDDVLCYRRVYAFLAVIPGIEGILLVLLLLELCISISTSAFGCKAVCCNSMSNMQSVIIMPNEYRPVMNINPVTSPMYNVKDQYRPEASCSSVPVPAAYNESNYRPAANLPIIINPMYNESNPCSTQDNCPSTAPLLPNIK
ncbi:membrane-spanning 4-domains subfamily A member 4A [Microcaecilia unicolor]|uniref:Membrane-spanning 4-domains subfamily A member 4A-like n=1 Tax=Microcaecilia unicolor TaxID=1415580 RepID=A0A6P7ZHX9_9AMPH|nr:membrane-spanning 4-domains subfamily A member 4A-like [Microcaecilia unicolor]